MITKSKTSVWKVLEFYRNINLDAMDKMKVDLSMRQVVVLLTVYTSEKNYNMGEITSILGFSKASICRAVDKLSSLNLLKRVRDESDRRIIYLTKTRHGSIFLSDFAQLIVSNIKTGK